MELRNGRIVGLIGPLPQDRRAAFEEGVATIFTHWTALCLAVENEWGGSKSVDKANGVIQDVIDWFYGRKEYHVDDLQVELEDAMLSEFNTECEDGSPRQVATNLIELHNQCLQGVTTLLDHLRSLPPTGAASSKRQVLDLDGAEMEGASDSSSDDGMSEEEEDEGAAPAAVPLQQAPQPRPAPVVDEDGFEMVQRRGRGRR